MYKKSVCLEKYIKDVLFSSHIKQFREKIMVSTKNRN